jgi:microcin C transport system substrate-binding protein
MRSFNRRAILKSGAAATAIGLLPKFGFAQENGETETHGLSSFGELK